MTTTKNIKQRLEYLRRELRAERISYGELTELQSLAEYIEPDDVELLQAAGQCSHQDDIQYYDVRANWTDPKSGDKYHAIDIRCSSCDREGVQIEVLDGDDYIFVTEYWN